MRLCYVALLAAAASAGAATVNLVYAGTIAYRDEALASTLSPGTSWSLVLTLDLDAVSVANPNYGMNAREFAGAILDFTFITGEWMGEYLGLGLGTASGLSPIFVLNETAGVDAVYFGAVFQPGISDVGYDPDYISQVPGALPPMFLQFEAWHAESWTDFSATSVGATLGEHLGAGAGDLVPGAGANLVFGSPSQNHLSFGEISYTSAIPEPSTYGLILAGAALAGAALRRRRKA